MIAKILSHIARVRRFLLVDLWRHEMLQLRGPLRLPLRLLHIVALSVKGYKHDRLPLHASALTFTTLMSLVPTLAITFAVLKGVSQETEMIANVESWIAPMPLEFQNFVRQNIINQVMNLNFKALGGLGVGILLFTLVRLLGAIEDSFNTVWGVRTGRSLTRKLTDYISTVVVVPLLVLVAGAVQSEWIVGHLGIAAPIYFTLLKFSSFFTAWMAFVFLLKFMPNTVVRLHAALLGGLVGAVAFICWQKMYIALQVGVVSRNHIFGAFATVPIFMAWLYVSWVIVLIAAELSYAIQSNADLIGEPLARRASPRTRSRLALRLLVETARHQQRKGEALNLDEFATASNVPLRLLHRVGQDLCAAGWLREAKGEDDEEEMYMLAWTPEQVEIARVITSLGDLGEDDGGERDAHPDIPSGDEEAAGLLAAYEAGAATALGRRTLADLLTPSPSEIPNAD